MSLLFLSEERIQKGLAQIKKYELLRIILYI